MEIRWKKIEKLCFFNRPLPVSFPFILVVSIQFMVNKIYRWLDSNCGSLVTEATTLPTAPQPLHEVSLFLASHPIWQYASVIHYCLKHSITKALCKMHDVCSTQITELSVTLFYCHIFG